jgi:glycosyltransferase involved in cell wall biosynthesis
MACDSAAAALVSTAPLHLAIATPWNERSAIAHANYAIASALRDLGINVTIVRIETGEALALPALSRDFPVAGERSVPRPRVGTDVDMICYAIGDFFPYHGAALRMMAEEPGLVLLHDMFLVGLAGELLQAAGLSMKALQEALGLPEPLPEATLEWYARNAPMAEWPAAMSTGAVVHARHYLDRVAAVCPGPVAVLPLPGRDRGIAAPRKRTPGSKVRLLTVGHVNPNKLPDEVIRAIAASPRLRDAASYRLVGQVQPEMRERLEVLAAELGVQLALTGALSNADLQAELTAADAIICLRRPVLEGASASAIEGLLSNRPVLVCDAGSYADIPDDVVLKVPEDANETAITRALERILDEPDAMQALGQAARAWALQTFTAKRYAAGLVEVVHASLNSALMVGLARRQRALTRSWGLAHDDDFHARIESIGKATFGF